MAKFITENDYSALVGFANTILREHEQNLDQVREFMGTQMTGKDLTQLITFLANMSRLFAGNAHKLKMHHDWSISPTPEWFDHYIDQYFQAQNGNCFWPERGVYSYQALKQGGKLLELCCGDGYNTQVFYACTASSIVAVDFDSEAIAHARRYHQAPNITFQCADIRTDLPKDTFDNIIWDAAIEHFTEAEIAALMGEIKSRLKPGGILSGHTIVEREDQQKHLHQHEREFRSKEDLASFFVPHFANVRVFETFHSARHNLYFYASDAAVPFDATWPGNISITSTNS